jgi:hypothetical protein
MARLNDIVQEHYVPTMKDVLLSCVRTTGIVESTFRIGSERIVICDTGGQRGERTKWIRCFNQVDAVIFVCSLSAYDQVLFEDETTNRMVSYTVQSQRHYVNCYLTGGRH